MEGTDWCQSKKTHNVQWIEGNVEQTGYDHIGERGAILNSDGNLGVGVALNADGTATDIQTGNDVTVSSSGRTQIRTKAETDGGGIANAALGVVGGIAEVTVGAATSEFGVGVFGIVDGSARIGLNIGRLGGYLPGNNDFGNAAPSNLGALAGKMIDGNDFYKVGRAQTILGIGNDVGTMVLTGTSWGGVSVSSSATVTGLVTDTYTLGYYYNQSTKNK